MHETFTQLARAGGGGSGGGSHGGGGGGGIVFPLLLGYLVPNVVCSRLRKNKDSRTAYILGGTFTVSWTLLFFIAIFVFVIEWRWDWLVGYLVVGACGSVWGGVAGLRNWDAKILDSIRSAKPLITKAANLDPAWNKDKLRERVSEIFYSYQNDWSDFDLEHIKTYTSPKYFNHVQLMLTALRNLKRTNRVNEPKLDSIAFIEIEDQQENSHDRFTALIKGSANDVLVDNTTDKKIFEDSNSFEEFWQFERQDDSWVLAGITQATEDTARVSSELRDFAASNDFCFSPDWGWLLLPQRGQLFAPANFTTSDINNHVIGLYHNILIEFYSYIPRTKQSRFGYTIAQATLPKSYGDIVVRRKTNPFAFFVSIKPHGLNKIRMEWGDFNKKYDVYATSAEQATSFELLDPLFMEKLDVLPFHVNIEVVDTVLYLYTTDRKASYASMLDILKEAFEEMKL